MFHNNRSKAALSNVAPGRQRVAVDDISREPDPRSYQPAQQRERPGPVRTLRQPGFLVFFVTLIILGGMSAGYIRTLRSIQVEVDGQTLHLRTHMLTVGDALSEARILLHPEDQVDPPADTPLTSGLQVHVQRAHTLNIIVDGEARTHRTFKASLGEALTEAGVKWIPEDRITLGDTPAPADYPLYAVPTSARRSTSSRGGFMSSGEVPPIQVTVKRAVPIGVQDGQIPYTFLTTALTLGEALLEKGIVLYAADTVEPPLDTPIQAGLSAVIDRSRSVTLLADGQTRQARTRTGTVADLLQEEGLTLGEMDYTNPALTEPISPGMRVTVVRVSEKEVEEQESIPFEEDFRGNPDLEIDHQQLDNPGEPGLLKRSLKVRYENGVEVSRSLDREWVEKPPQNRVLSYGTKIVQRQLVTPEGTFAYWRKLRVLATAYSAATCGKSRSDPTYGITRVGWKAGKGIIAVDPTVIPMFTDMYVPGYGPGKAGDTGGMIKGLHIDLGYDEDNLVHWWKWVDIYLLGSPPPPDKIQWALPNYPQER